MGDSENIEYERHIFYIDDIVKKYMMNNDVPLDTIVKKLKEFLSFQSISEIVELFTSLSILVNEMENEDLQKMLIKEYNLESIELTLDKVILFAIVYFILLTIFNQYNDYTLPNVKFVKFSPFWVFKNYNMYKYYGVDMLNYIVKTLNDGTINSDKNKIILRKKHSNIFKIVQKELFRKYYPGTFSNESSLLPFKVKAWEIFGKTFIEHDFSAVADLYGRERILFNSNNFINIYSESLFENIELYEENIPDYIELFLKSFNPYFDNIEKFSNKLNMYVSKDPNPNEFGFSNYKFHDKLFEYEKIVHNNIEEYKIKYNKFDDDGEHNFFYLFLNDYFLDNYEDGSQIADAFSNNRRYKNITELKMKNYLRRINVPLKQFKNNFKYTNVVNTLKNSNDTKLEMVKLYFGIDIFQKILEIIVGYKYFTSFTNSLIYKIFEIQGIDYDVTNSKNISISYFPITNYFNVVESENSVDFNYITDLLYKEKMIFDKINYFEF